MATFQKHNAFTENLSEKVHNLGSDLLTIALCSVAPTAANSILSDLTQIAYTNLASSRVVTVSTSAQTSGVYKLVLADVVLTATGAVASFRYVDLYNDTPTSPADPLIGFYDYGSAVVLAIQETFTVDFDPSAGALTLT